MGAPEYRQTEPAFHNRSLRESDVWSAKGREYTVVRNATFGVDLHNECAVAFDRQLACRFAAEAERLKTPAAQTA